MTPLEIGRQIRQTRLARGLTQPKLAVAVDVSIGFIGRLEYGQKSAHLGKTLAVLDHLGIEVQLVPPRADRRS